MAGGLLVQDRDTSEAPALSAAQAMGTNKHLSAAAACDLSLAMIVARASGVKCSASSSVMEVTWRSLPGSSMKRRTVSDIPSKGVNVIHTGPCVPTAWQARREWRMGLELAVVPRLFENVNALPAFILRQKVYNEFDRSPFVAKIAAALGIEPTS